ncbi:MAG: hypothetical protein WBO46_23470 [Caldilineaceae bacterium]
MSFFKNLFGRSKLDGDTLARSAELSDYAQIELLGHFATPRKLHDSREQHQWEQILPRPYVEIIDLFTRQEWLSFSGNVYRLTDTAKPFVAVYQARQEREKAEAIAAVHKALIEKDTSKALSVRRAYEDRQPLGTADWTGPDPQMSHSSLTRRILFLDHWLVEGLSAETLEWLKLYAANQHLWGAHWRLTADEIPASVRAELTTDKLDAAEAAYWRAYSLGLYVDNQETWQRCKGGDHVRRIEIGGPNDAETCMPCKVHLGQEYLVNRVPELPHKNCKSPYGCRCEYLPVVENYADIAE